jgi:enoyl-CoA hydratase/carnithine racemase
VSTWTLETRDRVAVLSFERPPQNWMNLASMTELADQLDDIARRVDEITVVMLTGAVDGYFIAHADLGVGLLAGCVSLCAVLIDCNTADIDAAAAAQQVIGGARAEAIALDQRPVGRSDLGAAIAVRDRPCPMRAAEGA